jgi:hypothetical protein
MSFKQADLTKILKAAKKAGEAVIRFEIDREGKIVVITACAPASAPDTDHETSADIRKLL